MKVGKIGELHWSPFCVFLLLLSLSHGRPPRGDMDGENHSSLPATATQSIHNSPQWDLERNNDDMDEEEEEDDDQTRFRNKILKELGLEESNIPNNSTMNISKEEYIAAYIQYMSNVRRRKEDLWKDVGPKRRRKNATTKINIFKGEGFADDDSMRTFHFDMNPAKLSEKDNIRVRRAELELPTGCRPLVNATRLINRGEYTYDFTNAVISWLFPSNNPSSISRNPSFQVSAFCNSPPLSSFANLRLVTIEFAKSRNRRSALTLQTFKLNKPQSGIDCVKTRRGKSCCRRSLKIKFTDLGISSEVIIEPQEFDAHVCVGRCNTKRVPYSSAHAMFQHIMHQTKGKSFAPRPCCTPTKFAELDVIHVNSANPNKPKLEVTVLKDAIVQECGCS